MKHSNGTWRALWGALFVVSLLLTGCGGGTSDDAASPDIVLSGQVDASAIPGSERRGPIFVAAAKTADMEQLENDPESVVVDIKPVDADNRYRMDVSLLGMSPGETVHLIAFIDNNFSDSPALDTGDFLGFYLPPESFDTAYTLRAGQNRNLDIAITREVFDFEAELGGTVFCDNGLFDCEGGHDLTIVAYAAPITSSDFTGLDTDGVIGFKTYEDVSFPLDYTLPILPYGYDVPIENVHLVAFLDVDGNGEVNAGDVVGSYAASADAMPACLTITGGMTPETDRFPVYMMQMVNAPASGSDITVSGSITMPFGGENRADMPVVLVVGDPDAMNDGESGLDAFEYFQMLSPGEYDFTLDLSSTRFAPGDAVMVTALWDRDFDGCFPDVSPGDWVGFYADAGSQQFSVVLADGDNPGIDIRISREVFDFEAEIGGTVFCDNGLFDCEGGHDITIVAYAEPITSSNFTGLDPDGVIGFKTYEDVSFPLDYTLPILPYGYDVPIENIHLVAFLDVDGNGEVNTGDVVGSYAASADAMPDCLTIYDGMAPATDRFPIYMMQTVSSSAAGSDITISGSITMPFGGENTADMPVVLAVGDPGAMGDGGGGFDAFDYFQILSPGEYAFTLDLSSTRFAPGDAVMVTALWDRDFNRCFPDVNPGDWVGFYADAGSQQFSVVLADGDTPGIDITITREVFDFEAEIGGTVFCDSGLFDCDGGHDITVVAYAGAITSLDFDELDPDAIIGFKTYAGTAFPLTYTLPILPYGYDVPIENVHVVAFLDINDNGMIDAGDILGSHADAAGGMPRCITIVDGMTPQTDVPIYFISEIAGAGGWDITLSGSVTLPPGGENRADEPVVVAVADPAVMLSGGSTLAAVDYFKTIPAGELDYELDLSGTRFVPGDEVMVFALWDRDYGGCFPELTPGDVVGFYSTGVQSLTVVLEDGSNPGIDIDINRAVYNFEAEIGGTVVCDGGAVTCENGHDLTIVAYAEPVNSLDFSELDPDGVIGYTTYTDVSFPLDYTLPILPYGYDVPIENVHVIAFLDADDDGAAGPDDIVGYHADENGMPAPVTITGGMTAATTDVGISMSTTIPQPGGYNMWVTGSIEPPDGYDADAPPIYIIITDEQDGLSEPDMSAIRYFQRLDAGAIDFDIDLSGTALAPGDRVTILALWDQDFNGFPVLTPVVDLLGIYMNTGSLEFGMALETGDNIVDPGQADWSFAVNRRYYDHDASVFFQINCNGNCGTGDDLIFGAITSQGVNGGSGFQPTGNTFDLDYVVGLDSAVVQADTNYWYEMDFLKILRDQAGVHPNPSDPSFPAGDFSMDAVYLFAVVDSNGDGQPDTGDAMGFYWEWVIFPLLRAPSDFAVSDTANVLGGNRVLFWGQTY
ncbi:hypothetical protein [Desulfosudis oleivorans]|uniref:EF-hand domain-containing protein n=1 Tax=Desulfosudis oleivorans (strain DSM 6200 / JCM 39069 / Hxd3) TaxID=96561 RepID=A8ZXB4_DESOH|nr:hypothetical protein [Desulfosudis oleivorans]ABW68493.1 hypothetical protein Dole_2690 [Desulfosudis oleivorans Hxd3]